MTSSTSRPDESFASTRSPTIRKLMKRPRSPKVVLTQLSSNSRPTSATSDSSDAFTSLETLEEDRKQRQMRSFLQNFLADEKGHFKTEINLEQHALDTGIAVTDATISEVVHTVPQVRALRLTGCSAITDAGIWSIARSCTELQEIHLGKCERITELGLRLLAHNCRLVTIDLSDCPQITDSILQTLAAGCWMIEKFLIRRCNRISDAGIVKIAQCCKELKHLDVSECERVGEFGDKALLEIGKYCQKLEVLDLFGCKHVQDVGIRAIAKGCPLLTTLKLTGCRDVSSVSFRALAKQCHNLQTLSLSGCIKITNQDLSELSYNCRSLAWLDISGSPNIDTGGVRDLAQNCKKLTYLSLSNCHRVGDAVLQALASWGVSLTSLSLAGCSRITPEGLDVLTSSCKLLLTLDVTNCENIGRRYLQTLIKRLEFVEWASAFFGYQPLANADELCHQRNRRLLEERSAVQIQAVMRGCLARGGLYQAKLRHIERKVLPKIQARCRGFIVRKRVRAQKQRQHERKCALIIAQAYRDYILRRRLALERRLNQIRQNEEEAALIFQKIFRGYQARKRVRALRDDLRRKKQLARRVHAMTELAAIKVQRAYRGHRGRTDASFLRAAKEARRIQSLKEERAARFIQRVFRGHEGRRLRSEKIKLLLRIQKENESATKIQALVRGHSGRKKARVLKEQYKEALKVRAASTIQRYWRGVKDKHLAAVLMGLLRLRAKENEAAKKIQRIFRMHQSRGFAKALRQAKQAQKKKARSALILQRVVRGHRGRAEAEVRRELCKLQSQARPLFAKEQKLEGAVIEQTNKVEALKKKIDADEIQEKLLAEELEKTMKIKTKYHDSSRITGTSQRYLTQYLQVQLADQLRAKRVEVALDSRTLEALTASLNDSQKQLRLVRRELQPLTEGVVKKTRENRTKRLQDRVRRERKAATTIQRIFRGYRVRTAMKEGGNCWVKLWSEELGRDYYYNMLTSVTRWTRPLAMDIFNDEYAKPVNNKSVWYEGYDEKTKATYYYNSLTKEYQWEKPSDLVDETNQKSNQPVSTRRQEWLKNQNVKALLSSSPIKRRLGEWEEREDPSSGNLFYSHVATGEVKSSLSPKSAHEDAPQSVRSARSVNTTRSVKWQFRYGYEYDASGRLVASAKDRHIWTEAVDAESGFTYYYNQLTNEYRWDKPEDFEHTFEESLKTPNESKEWFHEQDKSTLKARSSRGRALGKKWIEYVDPESKNVYYYNEVTGECRWSLSPRSARDTSDREDQIPLLLFEQVKSLKEDAVPYSSRENHMKWLELAVAEKNWKKADAIVEQIRIREQSVKSALASEALDSGKEPQNVWEEVRDEIGNVYYYNSHTGETSWLNPTLTQTT